MIETLFAKLMALFTLLGVQPKFETLWTEETTFSVVAPPGVAGRLQELMGGPPVELLIPGDPSRRVWLLALNTFPQSGLWFEVKGSVVAAGRWETKVDNSGNYGPNWRGVDALLRQITHELGQPGFRRAPQKGPPGGE